MELGFDTYTTGRIEDVDAAHHQVVILPPRHSTNFLELQGLSYAS